MSSPSAFSVFCTFWKNRENRRSIGGRFPKLLFRSTDRRSKSNRFHVNLPSLTNTTKEIEYMKRIEYERLFADYPDVVTLPVFREMLGGIGDGTARKLMWENRVEHFMIRTTYYIPKEKVIDYLMSPHYRKYKTKLQHRID